MQNGYVWVDDELSTMCSGCSQEFTMFFRKHHCRRCGKVFCNDCSKHRVKLPDDGYPDEKVRVCQHCNDIVTGVIKAVPEPARMKEDARAARDELFARGSSDPWEDSDGAEELRAQQDREFAMLQQQIFTSTADTLELGQDTLATLHAQREQTQNDMRKIECINQKLSAAEILIQKMERGMFNLGRTQTKIKPPASKASDVDFQVQVKRTVRYGSHILRFTKTFFLRLTATGDEIEDSVNYAQVGGISVSRSDKYFTISMKISGVKPWLMYATMHKQVIREMIKRAHTVGIIIPVTFEGKPWEPEPWLREPDPWLREPEPGSPEPAFVYSPEDHVDQSDGTTTVANARFLADYAGSGGKVDMDDMYDMLSQGLDQIQDVSLKQQEQLRLHTDELAEMQPQVANLHSTIAKANNRVNKIK